MPRAEYVLADELYPYSDGIFAFCGSLQQDTAISRVAVSPDGAYAATVDRHYVLRLFRTRTGEKLWERELYLSPQVCFPEGPEAVLAADLKSVSLISCPDGAELWRREGARLRGVSADGKTVLISDERTRFCSCWIWRPAGRCIRSGERTDCPISSMRPWIGAAAWPPCCARATATERRRAPVCSSGRRKGTASWSSTR